MEKKFKKKKKTKKTKKKKQKGKKRKRKKKKVRWNLHQSSSPEQSELQEKCCETHNNNIRAGNLT